MPFMIKLIVTVLIIVTASQLGKRIPTLGGLIATMPLTTLIVFFWLYAEHPDDYPRLVQYTKGVLWGIVPSIAFFLVVLVCLSRQWPLEQVFGAALTVWLLGACLHQWLLR